MSHLRQLIFFIHFTSAAITGVIISSSVTAAASVQVPVLRSLEEIPYHLSAAFMADSSDFPAHDELQKVLAAWRGRKAEVHFYTISPDVHQSQGSMMRQLEITTTPTFVLFQVKNKKVTVHKHIESFDFGYHQIHLALTAQTEECTTKLHQGSFFDEVLKPHNRQRPHLVLFYSHWAPQVLRYMNSFHTAGNILTELNTTILPASIDIHEHNLVLTQYLSEVNVRRFPFILYFYPIKRKHTVESMEYLQFSEELPTPITVVEFLRDAGHPLRDQAGNLIEYIPAGDPPIYEYSELTEGPLGYECGIHASNISDSNPKVWDRWVPLKVLVIKPYIAPRDWFSYKPADLEVIKSKLTVSTSGIPELTSADWHEVIEKTHRHDNPFSQAHDKEETTQVSIVIYVKESCDFCEKSMNTFVSIHNNTLKTGFPTLVAYRGISWLHHAKCLSTKTARKLKYARHDYHGLIMEKLIMDWIMEVSQPAVQFLRSSEEKSNFHKLDSDAHLVAVVSPKESKHLPARKRQSGKRSDRYPLECYRLVCERLYGMVGCAVEYHYKLTDDEIRSAPVSSLIVSHIDLHRRDGLETTVMELDRSFSMIMNSESDDTIHKLHPPHRYKISDTQTCEQDHSVCTDHVVQYTLDHARLTVSTLDTRTFHTHQGLIGNSNLPLLVGFVHPENISSTDTPLSQVLHEVGTELYTDFRVVTVDVYHFHSWANMIVPRHYSIDSLANGGTSWLYLYPRFCIISKDDHNHAAFFPEINNMTNPSLYNYTAEELIQFGRRYLRNPAKLLMETERF